jgi:hypothetical protein
MMEAVRTSETSVNIYLTTRQHIPEDSEPIKICSSSEDPSEYKLSWSYVDWCKFFIHLRSSNVRHFGLVTDTALEIVASRLHPYWISYIAPSFPFPFVPLQRSGVPGGTFVYIVPIFSNLERGGDIHRYADSQDDDNICLYFYFKRRVG